MIYRIVVEQHYFRDLETDLNKEPRWLLVRDGLDPRDGALGGLNAVPPLTYLMFELGLKPPTVKNPRARFYFTELGWNKIGRHVVRKARSLQLQVRVERRKNPPTSAIVYRDPFQLAILKSGKSS